MTMFAGGGRSRSLTIAAPRAGIAFAALILGSCTAAPLRHSAPLQATSEPSAPVLSFDEAIDQLAGRFASHGGRVAVLDFPDLARRQTQLGQLVSQSLTTSLVMASRDGRVRVLERLQVDQVMRELNFASANLTGDDVEHIGRALNADALVFGTAVSAGNGMVIVNARMVEVAGRTIIEAGRVTARIPPGISLAALPEPATVTTRVSRAGPLADQMGDVRGARDVFGADGMSAPPRRGAWVSTPTTTWVFELQQCTSSGDTRVTCDVTVTNSGPAAAPLALFFDRGQFTLGNTRIVDDRDIAYAPSSIRFSPSGAAYAYGASPAPAIALRDDVRRYPSMTPVRLSLEIDGVAARVSTFRTVEIVGGADQLSGAAPHDVIATFRDVAIQKAR